MERGDTLTATARPGSLPVPPSRSAKPFSLLRRSSIELAAMASAGEEGDARSGRAAPAETNRRLVKGGGGGGGGDALQPDIMEATIGEQEMAHVDLQLPTEPLEDRERRISISPASVPPA